MLNGNHRLVLQYKSQKRKMGTDLKRKIFIAANLILGGVLFNSTLVNSQQSKGSYTAIPMQARPEKKDARLNDKGYSVTNQHGFSKIEMLSFSAELFEKQVYLLWSFQKEPENVSFTIERSQNNENYFPIGSVAGRVPGALKNIYSLTDVNPPSGIAYYRLIQTDINGQNRIYPPTVVNNLNKSSVTLFPNPANSEFIHLSGFNEKTVPEITIRDITGKIVPSKSFMNENNIIDIEIDRSIASRKGVFIVTVKEGGMIYHYKLIIR